MFQKGCAREHEAGYTFQVIAALCGPSIHKSLLQQSVPVFAVNVEKGSRISNNFPENFLLTGTAEKLPFPSKAKFIPVSHSKKLKYSFQTEPDKFNRRDRRVGAKCWCIVVYDQRRKQRSAYKSLISLCPLRPFRGLRLKKVRYPSLIIQSDLRILIGMQAL